MNHSDAPLPIPQPDGLKDFCPPPSKIVQTIGQLSWEPPPWFRRVGWGSLECAPVPKRGFHPIICGFCLVLLAVCLLAGWHPKKPHFEKPALNPNFSQTGEIRLAMGCHLV